MMKTTNNLWDEHKANALLSLLNAISWIREYLYFVWLHLFSGVFFLSRPVIISPLSNTKYRQLKINQNRSQILDKRLFWNHFLDLANALKRRRSKLMPAKKWTPSIEEIDPVFPVGDENILSPEKWTWNFQVQRLNKRWNLFF